MPKTDYSAAVEIDGISLPVSVVTPLFQRDPFPGGHRYSLHVTGSRLERIFEQLARGSIVKPDSELSKDLFRSLTIILSRIRDPNRDSQPFVYFLNNIERVTFADQEVVMEGICSEVQTKHSS